MPFVELVLEILAVVIGFGLAACILFFAGTAAAILIGINLIVGWIPIVMCATDINMTIGQGFFGSWAKWSLYMYLAVSVGFVVLSFLRPDPDKLPPGWKFLAMFYRFETVTTAQTTASPSGQFDGDRYVAAVEKAPASPLRARLEARAMRKQTEKMDALLERQEAAAELAETQLDLDLLKEHQAELQRIIDEKEPK